MAVTAHPAKIDLLRWVFGRLDALREQRVLAHTRACPACRRRLVALIHAHRVLDVGGHALQGMRRHHALAAVVIALAIVAMMSNTAGLAPGLEAIEIGERGDRPPRDAAARLVLSAGADRMSPMEAQELILHATGLRRLLRITRPGVAGEHARQADELIDALDHLVAGDPLGAVGALDGERRSPRAVLILGLSLYAAGAEDSRAATLISEGLVESAGGGLIDAGHWVLGQLRLRQGDLQGARDHWARAAAGTHSSFARLAATALDELGLE